MGARLCTFRGVWIVDSVGVRGSAVAFEQVVRGGVPPRGRLVNVDGCGQRIAQGAGTGQSGAAVCDVLHIVGRVVARFHSCRGRFPTDPPPVPRRVPAVPPACPQPIPAPRPRGGAPPAKPRPTRGAPTAKSRASPPVPPQASSRTASGLLPYRLGPPPGRLLVHSWAAPGPLLDHGGELRRVGAVAPRQTPYSALLVRVQRDEVGGEAGEVHVGDGASRAGADGDHLADVSKMVLACIYVRLNLLAGLADRVTPSSRFARPRA